MPPVTGVTLVKRFTYRDDPTEEWSNTYWLDGSIPANNTAWETLFTELYTLERNVFGPSSSVVRALGYGSSEPHTPASHIVDYPPGTLAGTLVDATGHPLSGDQVGMIEWKTDAKNTRGKWIYLRKYLHDGFESSSDRDKISDATAAAYTTFAGQMIGGAFLGGRRLRGPQMSYNTLTPLPSEWTTTRTLKRRGKRPLA